jgi:hypothetical protein
MVGKRIAVTTICLVALICLPTPAHASSCGLTRYADGTAGPSVCPDGSANQAVAAAYRKSTPAIMGLKGDATRRQIQAAVCQDRTLNASGPALYDALEFQSASLGWSRSVVNPVIRNVVRDRYC